ncbi:MAG: thermonuclease family protein [Candidatus Omnitrophica bacterium]|jgi:micrococcal nuclease|nr:thermonuclease family protein [Candidatus Omnitrophota bacterium]
MRKSYIWIILGFIIVISLGLYQLNKQGALNPVDAQGTTIVKRAVDGDTLLLASGQRVRLIGIDTPETHDSPKLYRDSKRNKMSVRLIKAMGEKAYSFTRDLVEGKRVRLEFDVQKRDQYNRLLAYVYLEDGTFVNEKIIREGYAYLLTIPPDVKYASLFKEAFDEARVNHRGLWK